MWALSRTFAENDLAHRLRRVEWTPGAAGLARSSDALTRGRESWQLVVLGGDPVGRYACDFVSDRGGRARWAARGGLVALRPRTPQRALAHCAVRARGVHPRPGCDGRP